MDGSILYANPGLAGEVVLVDPGAEPTRPPRGSEFVAAGAARDPYAHLPTPDSVPSLRTLVAQYGDVAVDWMLADPKVKGSVNTLMDAVFAQGIQLSPAVSPPADAEENPDPARQADADRAKEISDFCERSLALVDPELPIAGRRLLYGAARYRSMVAKTTLAPGTGRDAGRWHLSKVKVLPRHCWQFGVDQYANTVGVYVRDEAGDRVLVERDAFVIMRWFPEGSDPRGTFLLESTLGAWNFKRGLLKKAWTYADLYSEPGIVGTTSELARDRIPRDSGGAPIPGATPITPQQDLYSSLKAFAAAKIIAAPAGTEIRPFEVRGEGGVHRNFLDYMDQEVVFSILHVVRATMEAEHGSKADSGTAQDMFGLAVRILKDYVAYTFRRDLFRPLTEANFGRSAAGLTPQVSLGRTEHQDLASLCGSLASMAAAGLIPPELTPILLTHLLGFPGVEPRWFKRLTIAEALALEGKAPPPEESGK